MTIRRKTYRGAAAPARGAAYAVRPYRVRRGRARARGPAPRGRPRPRVWCPHGGPYLAPLPTPLTGRRLDYNYCELESLSKGSPHYPLEDRARNQSHRDRFRRSDQIWVISDSESVLSVLSATDVSGWRSIRVDEGDTTYSPDVVMTPHRRVRDDSPVHS